MCNKFRQGTKFFLQVLKHFFHIQESRSFMRGTSVIEILMKTALDNDIDSTLIALVVCKIPFATCVFPEKMPSSAYIVCRGLRARY